MGYTEDGRPIHIEVYPKGGVARLNPGQFREHYVNGVSYAVTLDIRKLMDEGKYDAAWNHFVNYIEIIAPTMYRNAHEMNQRQRDETLEGIYQKGIYLQKTVGEDQNVMGVMERLMQFRRPIKTPITYTNLVGRVETSKLPVLVAEMQFMVLDKLDHKPMAISGVLRQHHGLPATQNKTTKHMRPSKENTPRVAGESENRAILAKQGGAAAAELRDLSTNPEAHRINVERIYIADNPMRIGSVFDRGQNGQPNPLPGRSLQYVRHVDESAGRGVRDLAPNVGFGGTHTLTDGTELYLKADPSQQDGGKS